MIRVLLGHRHLAQNHAGLGCGLFQHLLKQGACGFLSKPHRLPVVVKAIREALDGK
jgi:hypothetical protein